MPSDVGNQLHGMTHVDFSFDEVSSDFVYPKDYKEIFGSDSNSYQQSIQMFITLSAVIGVICILIIGCVSICCNCGNSDDDDDSNKVSTVAKYMRYFLSFACLVTIVVSFIYIFVLDSSIQDVQTTMDESYEPYRVFISEANGIQSTLTDAIAECTAIEDASTDTTVDSYVAAIRTDLETSDGYISLFLDDADTISWEDSGSSLNSAREGILYGCIGITVFAIIVVVVSLLTSIKIDGCTSIVSVLVIFGMILLWIIGSVQFGISVELADICNDPNIAVIQAINSSSFDSSNNDTILIMEYYIYCDDDHSTNPLINTIDSSFEVMVTLNSSIALVQSASNGTDYESNADALAEDYDTSLTQIESLTASLNCDSINEYYETLQHDMCFDLLSEWYAVYVTQWVTVGFLLLRLCFTCRDHVNRRVADLINA